MSIPSRLSVSLHITSMQEGMCIKLMDKIRSAPGMVSLTTEPWSSSIEKGYLSVKVHWMSSSWDWRCFISFVFTDNILPALFRHHCMKFWKMGTFNQSQSNTTYNEFKMDPCMAQIFSNITSEDNVARTALHFDIRFIAHVFNLLVRIVCR